jgi:hypothetical protein
MYVIYSLRKYQCQLCLNVYHPPWLATKERYAYTSLDWSSRTVRKKYAYEFHWIPLLRTKNSYLLGLSGPQPLDSYRLETWIRPGVNSNPSPVGYQPHHDELYYERKRLVSAPSTEERETRGLAEFKTSRRRRRQDQKEGHRRHKAKTTTTRPV